ncbi:hypothetical protein VTO42DRAFT_1107 [Malbranchea cinnamomea]
MASSAQLIRLAGAFRHLSIRAQSIRAFGTTPSNYEPRGLPRIANPSLWTSIVPKFIRERNSGIPQKAKSTEWNPATFFIVMAILIGSQAIRILSVRNDYDNFVRTTDAKIRKLREVIEKLNRGEEIDVREALGTGNPDAEAEWKQIIEELGRGESTLKQKVKPSKPGKPDEKSTTVNFSTPDEAVKKETRSRGNFF